MFLHLFMSKALEGTTRFELTSLGGEELVEVCDSQLHSCKAGCTDMGEIYCDVSRGVCSPGGEGTVGP